MDLAFLFIAALAAGIGLLLWAVTRQREVFRIGVEDGKPQVLAGTPPPGFLDDVRAIAKHVRTGVVRGVKEGGEIRIVASQSFDDSSMQRLRNAFSVRRRR